MTGIFRLVLSLTILKGVLEFKCKISPSLGGNSVNQLETQAFTAHSSPHLLEGIVIFIVLYIKQASVLGHASSHEKLILCCGVKGSPEGSADGQRCRIHERTQRHISLEKGCPSPTIKEIVFLGGKLLFLRTTQNFPILQKNHYIEISPTLVLTFPSTQMFLRLELRLGYDNRLQTRPKPLQILKPTCLEKRVYLDLLLSLFSLYAKMR